MSKVGPTQKAYDSLPSMLATLESGLMQAQRLLEPPAKRPSWWRGYWKGER